MTSVKTETTLSSPSGNPPRISATERILGSFRTYGLLPKLSGRGYLPLTLLARLPLAMLTIGTMSLITAVSHSYAIGGASAGAVGIGSAVGAPLVGLLADRRGQKPALYTFTILNVIFVGLLVVLGFAWDSLEAAPSIALACSLLAGATSPQVGALSRARWMAMIAADPKASPGLSDTAMSYEGTADELTFVLGPALVGIMAAFISPWLPLALAAALTLTLVPGFARHHSGVAVEAARVTRSQSDAASRSAEKKMTPLAWTGIALALLAMVCMGTFFGGTQASLSAFAGDKADPELAGLLYSAMGLSSALAALSLAAWPARFTHRMRWVACATILGAGQLLYLLPLGLNSIIPVLMLLGLAVGPIMVTVFAIGSQIAPPHRMATVMTALSSGIVAGTAIGYSFSGVLAENTGYQAAFLVPASAAVGLLLLGIIMSLLPKPSTLAVEESAPATA